MKRSTFLKSSLLSAAAVLSHTVAPGSDKKHKPQAKPFAMKFSPEFGIFSGAAGPDLTDQIRWGYDNGFRAWEHTNLKSKPVEVQEKISRTIQQLGMEFGQFVGTKTFSEVTFAGNDSGLREKVLQDIRDSVEIAKRMNTKFVHNVLGLADPKLPYDFQMANALELLKRIADIYEPHGLVMVMETMNHRINHPGMFLHTVPQAYMLAKAVGSPHVKILVDFYHVQIEEGNILPTIDHAWDEIAYIQIGDTPGRQEPTTGEINYKNVLQHVYNKGYRGFVGMEHRLSGTGEEGVRKVMAAYREIDPVP